MGISNENIGDVQMAQGDLGSALKSYETKRDIISRLARTDPGNTGWQRDLSVSYEKVGNVYAAQGNLPEALKAYRDGLAIFDRLAKTDPSNAVWQRDLAVSQAKLADVYRRQGEMALAKHALGKGLAIMQRMTALSPDNAQWKKDLAWFEAQIAALEAFALQEAQRSQAAFDAGQPNKAAAAQAKLAGAVEKAEREALAKPGRRPLPRSALSWYRLFAHDFKGALAASERAAALAPDPSTPPTGPMRCCSWAGRAKRRGCICATRASPSSKAASSGRPRSSTISRSSKSAG